MVVFSGPEIELDDIFAVFFLRNTKKHYFCILNLNKESHEKDISAIKAKEEE